MIDVVSLQYAKRYIRECPVQTLSYYDITLITEGEGSFCIDLDNHHVKPRDRLALIFEEEFLLSFFNDCNFLKNLSYFRVGRSSSKISLDNDTYNRISKLILEIQQEIANYRAKDKHLLRALLYETLIWLDRLYTSSTGSGSGREKNHRNIYIERFSALVEKSFRHDHSVQSYASQLCITPNYLNEIVKKATGINAKQAIINKILSEAKRCNRSNIISVQIFLELNLYRADFKGQDF